MSEYNFNLLQHFLVDVIVKYLACAGTFQSIAGVGIKSDMGEISVECTALHISKLEHC